MDPDAVQLPDKGKKSQRPVRISAWKLAKLDSNEAMKAANKARASSSVLRPIGSRHQAYDADYLSASSISGRSSPISIVRAGTSRLSPKSSYPPSRASREDIEASQHSVSSISSPHISNLTPSPLEQKTSNRDQYDPVPLSSTDPSQYSGKVTKGNENVAAAQMLVRKNNLGAAENKGSVDAGSSSQVYGEELLRTEESIFFGRPGMYGQARNSSSATNSSGLGRGSRYQQGRSQWGGQYPVFTPSSYQTYQSSQDCRKE